MALHKPSFPIRIFYDGACIVCANEVEHYQRIDRYGRLELIDISVPRFDPLTYGLNRDDVMRQLHVIDHAGRTYRGVDAFLVIWQAYPDKLFYRLLGKLVTLPGLNHVARFGYRCFARYRHLLPKRRTCRDDSCQFPQ